MQSRIIIAGGLCGLLLLGAGVFALAQTNKIDRQNYPSNLANTTPKSNSNGANRQISSNSAAAKEDPPDPPGAGCQFLTKEDAEKILGKKVYLDSSYTSVVDQVLSCSYNAENQPPEKRQSVRVDIKNFTDAEKAQAANQVKVKANELMRIKFPNRGLVTIKAVPDIGEGATLVSRSDGSGSLYVQKKTTAFEISIGQAGDKPFPAKVLEDVAKKIAGQLP